MCPYTDALQADSLSAKIAAHLKDPTGRWAIEYWPTGEGVDVVAARACRGGIAQGLGEMRQLGTMLLCDKAKQLVRGL